MGLQLTLPHGVLGKIRQGNICQYLRPNTTPAVPIIITIFIISWVYSILVGGTDDKRKKVQLAIRRGQRNREQAGQSGKKRKFIRGKRGWRALRENQRSPFLMESFLYPTNEKLFEGMVT